MYVVYKVEQESDIIYIGHGLEGRQTHVLSGTSHNRSLNELYFRHTLLGENLPTVSIISGCKTKEDAVQKEQELITYYKPICNKQLKFKDDFAATLKVF